MSTIVRATRGVRGANVVRVGGPRRAAWQLIYTLPIGGPISMAVFNGYLYVGTEEYGRIYRTSDGKTWTQVAQIADAYNVHGLCVFGSYLYAGVRHPPYVGKMHRSADGISWSEVYEFPNELPHGKIYDPRSLAVFGSHLYAAGVGWAHIYRSSDGLTWNLVATPDDLNECFSLSVFGSYLYRGTWSSLWRSSDGLVWNQIPGAPGAHDSVIFDGRFYVTGPYVISRSENGLDWTTVEDGVANAFGMDAGRSAIFAVDTWGLWDSSNGESWRLHKKIGFFTGAPYQQAVVEPFGNFVYAGCGSSRDIYRRIGA